MSARGWLLHARARDEGGFGMVELLAAMTIMIVGLLAVFSLFEAGIVQLRRASTVTTAAALADAEMEKFRAIKFSTLGLDATHTCPSGCTAADATYRSDSAYKADTTPTTTLGEALADTATGMLVAGFSGFPATAEYRVKIDNEILLVTAGAGTTTWTVKRAEDGTAAAAHSAGAVVTLKQRADVPSCSNPGPPSPCTSLVPTKTATGADGNSYRVDTYVTWTTVTNQEGAPGRALKQITVVVRDTTSPSREWARIVSTFDESTGL